jgi:hypothetical protein
MTTIQRKVHFQQGRRGRKQLRDGEPEVKLSGRVLRVTRLMALAIRFDQLIRDGSVADQAELARLGHVTRARLTQIMNLLCLAPDIQEDILLLSAPNRGRDAITERQLRPIAAMANWSRQRQLWRNCSPTPSIQGCL